MAIFKCKMCGGDLEITEGVSVAECQYCGTKQTLPKLDDDRRANLYDRANHFRRNNEFDKAMGIYEQILNEDNTDAEAYWSLVLCRYGIEYVEDPASRKRIPTVNRAQFTSIFADEDYKSVLQYADGYQRVVYEEEAKAIDEIQKGILAISQKEEPFDVFICYKETDNNGRRTPDSVLANDLYHQLKQEGFKVFFARITLEDKLGSAYEPYIFAALNSAKVMVVLGTKPEFFNAVWVRNEWSRYLALIKAGQKKMLIPAYKDMDPYDLPEEFSHLQAQDMSKLGFMQDLIRGIKKITKDDTVTSKETVIVNTSANPNIEPLIKRAFIFLEDGEFERADNFAEQVLNLDPENANAYLVKLMTELKIKTREGLSADLPEPLENYSNYQKAIRFGDTRLVSELEGYIYLNSYYKLVEVMKKTTTESKFLELSQAFEELAGFRDSGSLAKQCAEKAEEAHARELYRAEEARKQEIYDRAIKLKRNYYISSQYDAIELFETISGWRDVDTKIRECHKDIEKIKVQERRNKELQRIESERREQERKRTIKIVVPLVSISIFVVLFVIVLNEIIIPQSKYNKAVDLIEAGEYSEAITAFQELGDFKDSVKQIDRCQYKIASDLYDQGEYEEAATKFSTILDYGDSFERVEACKDALKEEDYQEALDLMNEKTYDEAIVAFRKLGSYKDSADKVIECQNAINSTEEGKYQSALALMEEKKYDEAILVFEELENYSDSNHKILECRDALAKIAYQVVIDEYAKMCAMDEDEYFEYESFLNVNKDTIRYFNTVPDSYEYAYYDIDGNGIYELIIRGIFYDVYAFDGLQAVNLGVGSGERIHLSIMDDGSMYVGGSSGASEGGLTIYRIASDGYSVYSDIRYSYVYPDSYSYYPEGHKYSGLSEPTFFKDDIIISQEEYEKETTSGTPVTDFDWVTFYEVETN